MVGRSSRTGKRDDVQEPNPRAIGDILSVCFLRKGLLGCGNHSCDSNLWLREATSLEARRDIAPGEELLRSVQMPGEPGEHGVGRTMVSEL